MTPASPDINITPETPVRAPSAVPVDDAVLPYEVASLDLRGRLTLCCQHSGIPGETDELAVDLATTSLAEGHRRLLDLVHAYQRERLVAAEAGTLGAWDLFPCNSCLKRFGKPHWTTEGTGGPQARRAAP